MLKGATAALLALICATVAPDWAAARTISYDFLNESESDGAVFSAFRAGDGAIVVKPAQHAGAGQVLSSKLGEWIGAVKRAPGREAFRCEVKPSRGLSRAPKIDQSSVSVAAGSAEAERTLYASAYNAYVFTTRADSGGQRVVSVLFARESAGPMGCEEAFGFAR